MKNCQICQKEIADGEPYFGSEDETQEIYLHSQCGLDYVLEKKMMVENWNQMVSDYKKGKI